jgi:hypothetical protein
MIQELNLYLLFVDGGMACGSPGNSDQWVPFGGFLLL